jgi:hypothetical protein
MHILRCTRTYTKGFIYFRRPYASFFLDVKLLQRLLVHGQAEILN